MIEDTLVKFYNDFEEYYKRNNSIDLIRQLQAQANATMSAEQTEAGQAYVRYKMAEREQSERQRLLRQFIRSQGAADVPPIEKAFETQVKDVLDKIMGAKGRIV